MKGRLIALDRLTDGRAAAALMVDGQLEDLFIDPPEDRGPALPGAIFRARLGRPMKGQGGAIVDLGDGLTGFLRETRGHAAGDSLLVQVSGVAERAKAPPVTTRLLFRSRYAIVTPGKPGLNISRAIRDEEIRVALHDIATEAMAGADDLGLILRTAAASADDYDVTADIAETRALAETILADADTGPGLLLDAPGAHLAAWRDWADPPAKTIDSDPGAFDGHSVWEALAETLAATVPLPGGGDMVIEATRALIAVDVNTGADTSLAAGLKANIAALRALPRALRLRGLAGQITVDLAPQPKKDRTQVEQILTAALRRDGSEANIAGWTPLGNLELQRKRDRLPLKELVRNGLPDM